jgi:capsule biosynthesis phosphatase
MNVIFLVNGLGERFSSSGYTKPKPLISIGGEPMFVKALRSHGFAEDDHVYIAYHRSLRQYNFEEVVRRAFPQSLPRVHFYCVPLDTKGAAHTLNLAAKEFQLGDAALLIADGDVIYDEPTVDSFRHLTSSAIGVSTNDSPEPLYSYVTEEEGRVTNIREKEKISDTICCGLYFIAPDDMGEVLRLTSKAHNAAAEVYLSSIYASLIAEKRCVALKRFSRFDCVGTPIQLQSYCEKSQTSPNGVRFCFDLDNTLVTSPSIPGDYSSVLPIDRNISFLKKVKAAGGYVIIYTARRMRTHAGNTSAVVADVAQVTIQTLQEFGIPYDELAFGKPWAQFYIDDLAISADEDLCKATGLYFNEIESRSWHEIKYVNGQCVKSGQLAGESHWYDNCPVEIVDKYAPKIYLNSEHKIVMEKINDLPLSHLYVRGLLADDAITKLFTVLEELHAHKPEKLPPFASGYYCDKLRQRAKSDIFAQNADARKLMEESISFFDGYEIEQDDICLIHGDPVFSNIFCSHDNKFTLIDPRGRVGDALTVYGHRFYDYAKVYQSIVGYDYVLLGMPVDIENVKRFKDHFESAFIRSFKQDEHLALVKRITKSLLVSLLPLHDSGKADNFVALIENL